MQVNAISYLKSLYVLSTTGAFTHRLWSHLLGFGAFNLDRLVRIVWCHEVNPYCVNEKVMVSCCLSWLETNIYRCKAVQRKDC